MDTSEQKMDFNELFAPKLAQFSELTGIKSRSEAINYLFNANWEIDRAMSDFHFKSRAKKLTNIVTFRIMNKPYILHIEVFDHLTVGHLKKEIYNSTGLSIYRQQLIGWENEPMDSTVLRTLNLRSPVRLELLEPMEH